MMPKRKVKGGLKTKGMRVAPYDKRKDMENMNESAKQAPFHTEGAGKAVEQSHAHPGNKKSE
jgi:hypothetical protein